jgi:hypothetical protein
LKKPEESGDLVWVDNLGKATGCSSISREAAKPVFPQGVGEGSQLNLI